MLSVIVTVAGLFQKRHTYVCTLVHGLPICIVDLFTKKWHSIDFPNAFVNPQRAEGVWTPSSGFSKKIYI